MLDQPEIVGRIGCARLRERLHCAPRRLVRDTPEAADPHSTMITMGWLESSE